MVKSDEKNPHTRKEAEQVLQATHRLLCSLPNQTRASNPWQELEKLTRKLNELLTSNAEKTMLQEIIAKIDRLIATCGEETLLELKKLLPNIK